MNKLIIGIECIRAGQPRAYADSVYEAIFTFATVDGVWIPDREQVLDYIKANYGHHFRVNPPEGNNPIDYLKTLEQLAANKWRVIIVCPFMD